MSTTRAVIFVLLLMLSLLTVSTVGILVTFFVRADLCIGCGQCVLVCPTKAISIDNITYKAIIDPDLCIRCGKCAIVCPTGSARPLFVKPPY